MIVVACVMMFWAIALVSNLGRSSVPMLKDVEVHVPSHTVGDAALVELTRTAPARVEAVWSSNVHNTARGVAVEGCSEFGAADYEGEGTATFPLYREGCKLKPGNYYFRACWTPEQAQLGGLCARSNTFKVRRS